MQFKIKLNQSLHIIPRNLTELNCNWTQNTVYKLMHELSFHFVHSNFARVSKGIKRSKYTMERL
jgi:hypothetical protein